MAGASKGNLRLIGNALRHACGAGAEPLIQSDCRRDFLATYFIRSLQIRVAQPISERQTARRLPAILQIEFQLVRFVAAS